MPDTDAVSRGAGRIRSTASNPVVILTCLFLISRAIYFAAGVRMEMFDRVTPHTSLFPYPWQLLDPTLLQHHLVDSVWHLNSQPPLFNLGVGLLLKLPDGTQAPLAAAVFLLLGLTMVLSTFAILVDLRVPTWLALAGGALIIADPAYVLYENWLSYSYPTAVFLTTSVLCLVRYARTRSPWWGLGFFSSVLIVALLNSAYQLPWLVAILIVVFIGLRGQWRSVVTVAALPVLLMVGWVVKDALQVGTLTTSSWIGMNFTRTTLDAADPAEIRQLVDAHVLTPIAEIPAFSPFSAYVPRFVRATKTGDAAVDAPSFDHGSTNFNNTIYVDVSRQYLHDDLAFVRARPRVYALTAFRAARYWTVPSDEYAYVELNRSRIAGWADTFDRMILLRPAANPASVIDSLYFHTGPAATQMSYGTILLDVCAILGAPIVAWYRRRDDTATATTMAYLFVTITYMFVTTSLIELGENQKFSMELGPLPLVAAIVVLYSAVHSWGLRRRRRLTGDGRPGLPAERMDGLEPEPVDDMQ